MHSHVMRVAFMFPNSATLYTIKNLLATKEIFLYKKPPNTKQCFGNLKNDSKLN